MFKFKPNKNLILLGIAVIGIIVTGAIIFTTQISNEQSAEKKNIDTLSVEEVSKKAIDYINNDLLKGTATASLLGATEESGLAKLRIKIENDEFDGYVTLDGKLFFPQTFKLDEATNQGSTEPTSEEKQKSCEEMTKTNKPLLAAFVVSECPYGLQMQRILAEVVKNISSLAENIKVRYIGSISGGKITSMHGDEEAQENLRQICIREEASNKYWNYISCHIKKGDVDTCLSAAGISKSEVNACMTDKSRGLEYAKEDFDIQDKFQVQGSPTLILNDKEADEFSFGGRTAEATKTMLCCAFNNKPEVCSQKLNEGQAATGFSDNYASASGSSNSGGCQ